MMCSCGKPARPGRTACWRRACARPGRALANLPDPPAPTGRTGRYADAIFWPDTHVVDHDARAVALALKVARYVNPSELVILGDFLDAKGLARFPKNPVQKSSLLQTEIDTGKALLREIRGATPRARRRFIRGNHEDRVERTAWKIPALANLKALGVSALLDLAGNGFDPTAYDRILFAAGRLLAMHGTFARKDPGQSVKAHVLEALVSVIMGHKHTLCTFPYTAEGAELEGIEAGHLQNNPPEWKSVRQNWQQGLVHVELEVDGPAFEPHLIRIRPSYRARVLRKELSA